jgi:two-component system OmpR family response regulator
MPKILIVDDEKDIREGLRAYLQKHIQGEIEAASDGYAALEKLRSAAYDAVLLDISMPGLSGREVLKEVRALAPDAAVFVLTRWDSLDIAGEIEAAGAVYIPKPYAPKVVLARIVEKLKI